ncbi:MAG: hypothetical protein NTY65_03125 [Planctomycetota bacterium]|nr:hypothetical protein [Planctomycetota bacterium]
MTTDQRIENLEKGLASARRLNRWLLAAVGLIALAGISAAEQPQAVPPPSTAPAAPIIAPAPAPQVPPGGCLYRGKPRLATWVDIQFAKFRDKIAKIDGQWRDCGKGIIDPDGVGVAPPAPGTEIRPAPADSQVLTIINAAEILAIRPFFPAHPVWRTTITFQPYGPGGRTVDATQERPQIIFHIRGIKSQGLTDGMQLARFGFHHKDLSTSEVTWAPPDSPPEEWLVYCGTYTYRGTDDSRRTVPSYAIFHPATREEFVEACASGLTLTDYGPRLQKSIDKNVYPKPVP